MSSSTGFSQRRFADVYLYIGQVSFFVLYGCAIKRAHIYATCSWNMIRTVIFLLWETLSRQYYCNPSISRNLSSDEVTVPQLLSAILELATTVVSSTTEHRRKCGTEGSTKWSGLPTSRKNTVRATRNTFILRFWHGRNVRFHMKFAPK